MLKEQRSRNKNKYKIKNLLKIMQMPNTAIGHLSYVLDQRQSSLIQKNTVLPAMELLTRVCFRTLLHPGREALAVSAFYSQLPGKYEIFWHHFLRTLNNNSDWMLAVIKTTVFVPSMCSHSSQALLINTINNVQLHARPFFLRVFAVPVFPFAPCVRLCHSEGGVSLSTSSGDEPTAASSLRPASFGLGMGAKQRSDQSERLTLAGL